jgi:hypothetical protein
LPGLASLSVTAAALAAGFLRFLMTGLGPRWGGIDSHASRPDLAGCR